MMTRWKWKQLVLLGILAQGMLWGEETSFVQAVGDQFSRSQGVAGVYPVDGNRQSSTLFPVDLISAIPSGSVYQVDAGDEMDDLCGTSCCAMESCDCCPCSCNPMGEFAGLSARGFPGTACGGYGGCFAGGGGGGGGGAVGENCPSIPEDPGEIIPPPEILIPEPGLLSLLVGLSACIVGKGRRLVRNRRFC